MQTFKSLVISGASGQLGRRVAELLLQQGQQKIILVSREPTKLNALVERGAIVRFGDFNEPNTLKTAFQGGESLLLISTTDLSTRTQQHNSAIAAAVTAGMRHICYTSMLAPEPANPAVITASHLSTEQALFASGLEWTLLRNSLYADFQLPELQRALSNRLWLHNRGLGEVAYVSREDCARAATAVMSGDHVGKIYEITGPQRWNAAALNLLYSDLSGVALTATNLDDTAFIESMLAQSPGQGHARYGAELVASFGKAIRDGWFAACTDTVAKLTGQPAIGLRELLAASLQKN